jgi:hypothetical protein
MHIGFAWLPVDLNLFFPLKSQMIGRRFCKARDIMKNVTDELKRFSQDGFQKSFQQNYCRWQKYTVARGKCFLMEM